MHQFIIKYSPQAKAPAASPKLNSCSNLFFRRQRRAPNLEFSTYAQLTASRFTLR